MATIFRGRRLYEDLSVDLTCISGSGQHVKACVLDFIFGDGLGWRDRPGLIGP